MLDNRKTALYCRTATYNDFVIKNQEERLRRFAKKNGYTNPACYTDNGENGLTLDNPGMKRLIADIESGNVQTVIVIRVDRIARSYERLLEWKMLIEKYDVECISVDESKLGFDSCFAMADARKALAAI